jgi:hypothetical protein
MDRRARQPSKAASPRHRRDAGVLEVRAPYIHPTARRPGREQRANAGDDALQAVP